MGILDYSLYLSLAAFALGVSILIAAVYHKLAHKRKERIEKYVLICGFLFIVSGFVLLVFNLSNTQVSETIPSRPLNEWVFWVGVVGFAFSFFPFGPIVLITFFPKLNLTTRFRRFMKTHGETASSLAFGAGIAMIVYVYSALLYSAYHAYSTTPFTIPPIGYAFLIFLMMAIASGVFLIYASLPFTPLISRRSSMIATLILVAPMGLVVVSLLLSLLMGSV